jgi:hypothetical protein
MDLVEVLADGGHFSLSFFVSPVHILMSNFTLLTFPPIRTSISVVQADVCRRFRHSF